MRIFWPVLVATAACGGAPARTPTTAAHHDDVVVTTSPVASSPPLFTGAFEMVKMSDEKQSLTFADLLHALKAHDGRMVWELGEGTFEIGMWTVSEPGKLNEADTDANGQFAFFCRATGTVDSHWEGSTLVLASTIKASAAGAAVRIHEAHRAGEKTRTVTTHKNNCDASFSTTRITFEIVEKDASGPTRVRGRAQGGTFELVRGTPLESVDPSKIYANGP